jgi:hypothetical protein
MSVVGVTLRTNGNIAFASAYHVVRCPECRRRVIGVRMHARLNGDHRGVDRRDGAWSIELEIMTHQVPPMVEVEPQGGIHTLGAGHQGSPVACATPAVPVAALTVDELIFRGHRRPGTPFGGYAVSRQLEEPVTDAYG